MVRQLEEDQCLSSCTKWKRNPLFKVDQSSLPGESHYQAKWWEPSYFDQNTFPQLHDAPMLPEDLNCLEGCFDIFQKDSVLLGRIQKECSLIGLDRQIPTHIKEGDDLVNSGFTSIIPSGVPLPLNPNLDCLLYYAMSERKGCRSSNDGVCNFIADQEPSDRNRVNSGKTKQSSIPPIPIPPIPPIVSNVTNTGDFKNFILRASSLVTRAISLCAQAKVNQLWKVNVNVSVNYADLVTLAELGNEPEQTCDSFMPDIFGSLCSCIGGCVPRHFDPTNDTDPNLILHFHTDQGLWGCQDACKRTEECEFYTHSKLSNFEDQTKYAEIPTSPVFHCFLWRNCDTFFIPNTRPKATGDGWLDLRSGPKDCSLYTQKCPVVKNAFGTLDPLPAGYTLQPSCQAGGGDTTCGFEVRNCYYDMLSSCTLTLIFPY